MVGHTSLISKAATLNLTEIFIPDAYTTKDPDAQQN